MEQPLSSRTDRSNDTRATISAVHAETDGMASAYLEMLKLPLIKVVLGVLSVIVVVFTITGPLGTYASLSLPRRLAYFALCVVLAWPVCYSKSVLTLYFMRMRSARTITLALVPVTLMAALPVTAIVYAVDRLMRPAHIEHILSGTAGGAGLFTIYLLVAAVMMSSSFLIHYLVCQRVDRAAGAVPEPATASADAPASTLTVPKAGTQRGAAVADHPGGGRNASGAHGTAVAGRHQTDRLAFANGATSRRDDRIGTRARSRALSAERLDVKHQSGMLERLPRGLSEDIICLKSRGPLRQGVHHRRFLHDHDPLRRCRGRGRKPRYAGASLFLGRSAPCQQIGTTRQPYLAPPYQRSPGTG